MPARQAGGRKTEIAASDSPVVLAAAAGGNIALIFKCNRAFILRQVRRRLILSQERAGCNDENRENARRSKAGRPGH